MDDLISRKQTLDAFGLSEKTRKYGGDHSGYDPMMLYEIQDVIEGLPSVNPQANNEDIHREREQAYMRGYEDGSKKYRTEQSEDAISRKTVLDAMCDASVPIVYKGKPTFVVDYVGLIADIPSVNSEKPNRCEDAISRSDAIRVASGYCHWTNIPDELAKLPSVNPIPCDDAISRQEALNAMNELPHEYRNKEQRARTGGIAACKMIVEELPSVGTEKTGRWIMPVQDDGMSDPIYYQIRCSKCGFDLDPQTWHQELHQYGADKYCPKCGCKMQEMEEI